MKHIRRITIPAKAMDQVGGEGDHGYDGGGDAIFGWWVSHQHHLVPDRNLRNCPGIPGKTLVAQDWPHAIHIHPALWAAFCRYILGAALPFFMKH